MRKSFRLASLALPVALVALLSGCLPPDPIITPVPDPTSTPVFESEEEALAAAAAAYAEYQSAVDTALATIDVTGLSLVADGEALLAATNSVDEFKSDGRVFVGTSSIDTVSLVQGGGVLGSAPMEEPAQIYACLDVSKTDVLDSAGKSVLPPDRKSRFPVIVDLTWSMEDSRFRVSKEEVWDGVDFCA